MSGTTPNAKVLQFGVFEVHLQTGELRKSGLRIKLQEQPFQILALLLERPGEVITREELRQRLWPSDTFVDFDHSLNSAIKKLRQALGDDSDNPRFVETLPRRGYRIIVPVKGGVPSSGLPAAEVPPATPPESSAGKNLLKRTGVIAGVVVLALICVAFWRSQPQPPTVTNIVQITNDGKAKNPINPPVTDGVHLYFTEGTPDTTGSGIAQVSAAGGETTWITTTLQDVWAVSPVSPDRSELLVSKVARVGSDSVIRTLGATTAGRCAPPRRKHQRDPRNLDAGWDTHRVRGCGQHNDGEQRWKRASSTGEGFRPRVLHSVFAGWPADPL